MADAGGIMTAKYSGYQGQFLSGVQAIIANGGTESANIALNGMCLCGIFFPAAFTGTAVTFEASLDGTTFFAVKSTTSGTSLSYTVAQGEYVAINPVDFQGIATLRIVSGSSEGAARTLNLSLKGI